jgi:hypothetical protein
MGAAKSMQATAEETVSATVRVDSKRLHKLLTSCHALPGRLLVCT